MTVRAIRLNDGHAIPQLGLGVFQVPASETARVVGQALEIGYRHVDTAQMYGNEAGVGAAVAASGLPREAVFVTTKLSNGNHRPDDARRSFDRSLEALGLDHVDLFLIHWPRPRQDPDGYVAAWRVLEELARDGRARSIGVSNFQIEHLERLAAETDVVPAVNQIELHPYFQNREVAAWCERHGVVTEAWAPIARGAVLGDPVVEELAAAHGRTAAQVVLRWHLQRGFVVFPKSSSVGRLRENFDVFDFELSPAETARLDGLDRGEAGRTGLHPTSFG
jgi:2,5-diketo-D-gluconate reductase A